MSKSNVNPNHFKLAGRERQGEDIAQARHKQKHAQSLVRVRYESQAFAPKRPLAPAPPRPAAAPKPSAKQASSTARVNVQASDKRGKRTTAQKRTAVAVPAGKERSVRRTNRKR